MKTDFHEMVKKFGIFSALDVVFLFLLSVIALDSAASLMARVAAGFPCCP